MAEEREVGVAGEQVVGEAEVPGGREQGVRDRGTVTDPDVAPNAGRPTLEADDEDGGASGGAPGFAQGDTPSEEELSEPDVGGTAGGGPAGA